MNLSNLIRAVLACFQGDKAVIPELKQASDNEVARWQRILALREERRSIKLLQASLRRRKKRFKHLDVNVALIEDALDELESAK